ncbi:MAG: hypothetical protein JST63_08390 [Bacteroidetes bacterium]|nr:hypothetical protein [Bacteroidota bacterium]
MQEQNYYSFNYELFHFVVPDANYTREGISYYKGNFDWKDCFIPEDHLAWLREKLSTYYSIRPLAVRLFRI